MRTKKQVNTSYYLCRLVLSLGTPPFNPDIISGGLQNGPARFEPWYNVNDAGTLILTNGGQMMLHQDCVFGAVIVEGTSLANGTYTFAQLAAQFAATTNFVTSGCGAGSITVRPYDTT